MPLTAIFVDDQEAALAFFTDKLGLDKIQDEPYSEGTRWITVSPKGARMTIALRKAEKAHEKAMVGRSDGALVLILSTDDVRAAYETGRAVFPGALPLPVGTRRDPARSGRQPLLLQQEEEPG